MSSKASRKVVAAAPHGDTSMPALLSRLRDLRKRMPSDLSVEEVESQLMRIKAAKLSKAKAQQNLRDRIIYALTHRRRGPRRLSALMGAIPHWVGVWR